MFRLNVATRLGYIRSQKSSINDFHDIDLGGLGSSKMGGGLEKSSIPYYMYAYLHSPTAPPWERRRGHHMHATNAGGAHARAASTHRYLP